MVRLSSAVGSQQTIGNAALMQRADDVLRMRIETTIRSLFSQVPSLLSCSQSRKVRLELSHLTPCTIGLARKNGAQHVASLEKCRLARPSLGRADRSAAEASLVAALASARLV